MKQSKIFKTVLFSLVLACTLVLCSCKPEDKECEHEWSSWTTVQAASCVQKGLQSRTCSKCNETEEKELPIVAHTLVKNECSVCGLNLNTFNQLTNGKEYDEDYKDLYTVYSDTVITDVKKDVKGYYIEKKDRVYNETSKNWVDLQESTAKKHYLGLDFLSMAMVYNTTVPTGSTYQSADDVYAQWWKMFIERWNELLPEIPLYSNEYYDLYNAKLSGLEGNYKTNPYWSVSNALVGWSSSDGKIIIGNSTDLSGKFRFASFGASSPGAADNDVAALTSGLSTVTTNAEGAYVYNPTVVKTHSEKLNEDGTKTYTIEIYDDLKFSDGSAINVDNFFVSPLVFSTPVANEAAKKDHKAAMSIVGYEEFSKYDGTNDGNGASKYLSGLKKETAYKFSVTVSAEYAEYYYGVANAAFGPEYIPMWVGQGNSIEYNEAGNPGLSNGFYAKSNDSYTVAATIKATATNTDQTYPYSGPYTVKSYDANTKTAVLEKNTYFKGDVYGTKPSIGTITYKKIISTTQLADFKAGNLDFIAGITGGADTDEATKYADENPTKAKYIHYGRAGYGKLGFRGDFGPVQFVEVRQALAYCLNRAQFALDFNGGYGGKVDGPYYAGSWMYKAVESEIELNSYETSVDTAKQLLEAAGWKYAADGSAYVSGVRHKLVKAADLTEADLTFAAKDESYEMVPVQVDAQGKITVLDKADGAEYFLMPCVINWFGTQDNEFTTYVIQYCCIPNCPVEKAGMKVLYNIGDFAPMLDELYQAPVYGFYAGTPVYEMFNFATGFNSAVYDYSYNCTIDPSMYEDYSMWYVKDINDIYFIPQA